MAEPHAEDVFVYFKAARNARNAVMHCLDTNVPALADDSGCRATWSRRVELQTTDAPDDTWLEHYQCTDGEVALRLLAALAALGAGHPLCEFVIGGVGGRHVEHFVRVGRVGRE